MNTEHRYIFEKGSKKYRCPECTKKRFVRYVDTKTSELLPDQYGRCDRESKCGYFLTPYKDGYAKAIREQEQGNDTDWKPYPSQPIKKPVIKPKRTFIPFKVFKRTCAGYELNNFIQNLLTRVGFPFEIQDLEKVISLFHIGTVQNGYHKGATCFPFIDINSNVRTIQVKQFDETNHTIGTNFLHSMIEKHHIQNNKPLPEWLEVYKENETKVSCLFGEHLLPKYPHNPVALVEAPKTAIYGTLYFGFPEQPTNLLWLAVYNLSSLNLNKCKALKGRNVYLFPDLSINGKAFELWSNKASQIQKQLHGTYFHVSDLLEHLAPLMDKAQGKDIADYLIKQDWRLFRKQNTTSPEPIKTITREKGEKSEVQIKTFSSMPTPIDNEVNVNPTLKQSESWDNYIANLEKDFRSIEIPKLPIKLNECTIIHDCQLFIESQFAALRAKNCNILCVEHLKRLHELKRILTSKTYLDENKRTSPHKLSA